ncbi:MAG: hypothetical protein AMXMBFR61_23620 [Fimbriimonadales bacterium]
MHDPHPNPPPSASLQGEGAATGSAPRVVAIMCDRPSEPVAMLHPASSQTMRHAEPDLIPNLAPSWTCRHPDPAVMLSLSKHDPAGRTFSNPLGGSGTHTCMLRQAQHDG